jgi:hypothetical protein
VLPPMIARLVLHLLHVWTWALYCGSVTYIYFRLFPDLRRWLASDDRFEEFSLVTGDGLRWWIFGALAAAGVTGGGLVLLRPRAHPSSVWWTFIALKAALFVVTLAVYAYVSYVMWPRRVFVSVTERSAEQRRFFRVALILMACLIGQLVLGALAHAS